MGPEARETLGMSHAQGIVFSRMSQLGKQKLRVWVRGRSPSGWEQQVGWSWRAAGAVSGGVEDRLAGGLLPRDDWRVSWQKWREQA